MVTPIIINDVLYVTNGFGLVEAMNPKPARHCEPRATIDGPEGLCVGGDQ